MQAPNGAWVTPAFSLSRSKLDEMRPLPAAPAAPPPMPPSAKTPQETPLDTRYTTAQRSGSAADAATPSAPEGHCGREGSAARPQEATASPARPCRSMWFTHVVFDCDGVLVDSERASCEALRLAVLDVTGVPSGCSACPRSHHTAAVLAPRPCHRDLLPAVRTSWFGSWFGWGYQLAMGLHVYSVARTEMFCTSRRGGVVQCGSRAMLPSCAASQVMALDCMPPPER